MNYAIVAIGGVTLIVCLVWLMWGRFNFTGPVPTMNEYEADVHVKKEE